MAVYLDNFDSCNAGTLAGQGQWVTAKNQLYVESDGTVRPAQSGSESGVYYNDTTGNDQYSQAVVASFGASSNALGVGVRMSSGNYYAYYGDSANCYLGKVVSGTWTTLATGKGFSTGDVIRLEVIGKTLFTYKNGRLDTSINDNGVLVDSSISSGKPGITGYGSTTTLKIDSWEGGDSAPTLLNGLVCYMGLNETSGSYCVDSATGLAGTITGATINQTGKIGRCVSLDGSGDKIDFGGIVELDPGTGDWSFSCWFKTTASLDSSGNIYSLFATTSDASYQTGIWITLRGSSSWKGMLLRFTDDGSNYTDITPANDIRSSINDGNWHHLAVTLDRDANATIYFDNSNVGSGSMSGYSGNIGHYGTTRIGMYSSAYVFNGQIDEVAIYKRLLSTSEISSLYNSGSGNAYPFGETIDITDELLGYWKLDESSGTAIDAHGDNDGTVGAGVTQGATGKINTGYDHNGSSSAVTLPAISTGADKTASISLWGKSDTIGITWRKLIGRYWSQHAIGTWGESYWRGVWNGYGDASNVPVDTNWHHFVLTYDGNIPSSNIKFYIDGVLVTVKNHTTDTGQETEPWQIGAHGNSSEHFDGTIDEVAIFRRAISNYEVIKLYNSGNGFAYPFVDILDIAASISGSAGITSALSLLKAVSASISGQGSVQSNLSLWSDIAAGISGSTEAGSALFATTDIGASISGQTSLTANLLQWIQIASVITGQAQVDSILTLYESLTAESIAGQSDINSALDLISSISSAIAGNTEIQAQIGLIALLATLIEGDSELTANLNLIYEIAELAAQITGTASLAANMGLIKEFSAAMQGNTSLNSPELLRFVEMASQISGNTSTEAILKATESLTALIEGSTSIVTNLSLKKFMESIISGNSVVTAQVIIGASTEVLYLISEVTKMLYKRSGFDGLLLLESGIKKILSRRSAARKAMTLESHVKEIITFKSKTK